LSSPSGIFGPSATKRIENLQNYSDLRPSAGPSAPDTGLSIDCADANRSLQSTRGTVLGWSLRRRVGATCDRVFGGDSPLQAPLNALAAR
jgi:hypothetical protein